MKKTSKVILISISIILFVSVVGILLFFVLNRSEKEDVWNFIPHDAVYIIETNNLSKGWNTIAESAIWSQMINNPLFEDFQEDAFALDSLIRLDKTMNKILSNKASLISCHLINNNNYDFLFVIDIKQAGKLAFLKTHLKKLVGFYGYDMAIDKFKDVDILKFTDQTDGEVVYVSLVDNVLMVSYNKSLIQKSAIASQHPEYWKEENNFQKIASKTSGSSLFHFYVSHSYLPQLISYYVTDQDKLLAELKKIFNYSAFNFDFNENQLIFDGTTILKDSVGSYLHTLSQIASGKRQAYRIIPSDMALYLSITFSDYMQFYNKLIDKFASTDSTYAETYTKSVKKVEKLLKINVEKDFFSWIGNEIALVKLSPDANAKEYDMLACLHTNNIDNAKKGLNEICKQVDKKTPVKVTESEYKGITIHYFALNGFFKLFFGKMFARLDKPYFIYLDDFVVFSNSKGALTDVIDAWLKRRTLENNDEFTEFAENFDKKSNVSLFLKGPKIYKHLYYYAKNNRKNEIRDNKELISSFQYTGFQLVSEATGLFANKLIIQHNKDALFEDELEQIENKAEELYIDEFSALIDSIKLPENVENGKNYRIFEDNDSTKLLAEGRIKRKKPDDIWRFYYPNDNIKATVTFNKGTPDGKALLFYNSESSNTMAQVKFDNGKKDGAYYEYYKNGKPKCELEFKDDELTGNARFYYKSGQLKIEGKYKKSLRTGKWKHYTESGELYNKERWKKDRKK